MAWMIGRGAQFGFSAAVIALLLSAAVSYRNIRKIAINEALVSHTHQVLDRVQTVFSNVKDAESGQRGYIITGLPTYLDPYNQAAETINREFDELTPLTSDNAGQQERLSEIRTAVQTRLATLREGIQAVDSGGVDAGRAFVLEGKGRVQMSEIRTKINQFVEVERKLLAERSEAAQATYQTAHTTLVITTAVGLIMVLSSFYFAYRDSAHRARMTEQLEQRVADRTRELSKLNEALRISNRELEQFASVASHDLQEPLRKIEAFGDRIKTRNAAQLDESGKDYLDRVLTSATRMRSLINDLLSFSRVTTRGQTPESVDLAKTAREVVSDLEGRLQLVGGRVDVGDLPTIDADPLQMRQLLQNLIGNALKFHQPDVPPVVVISAEIVRPPNNAAVCRLTVKDNGIGFEEVYLDRIFNVFQRLHGRNEYEGTGMGLAISRRIVERHGGTITAESVPGKGATFIVTLPVSQTKELPDAEIR
jgi:signal transduction histidine kinase